jgi:predicted ester cyclase
MLLFMSEYRGAFPDLCFRPVGDLIAQGDRVVVRWEGGGTHTGKTFGDISSRVLHERSGRKMWISGTTLLTVMNGRIVREEILADGVTAMLQLGLMRPATPEEWASNQQQFARYQPSGTG